MRDFVSVQQTNPGNREANLARFLESIQHICIWSSGLYSHFATTSTTHLANTGSIWFMRTIKFSKCPPQGGSFSDLKRLYFWDLPTVFAVEARRWTPQRVAEGYSQGCNTCPVSWGAQNPNAAFVRTKLKPKTIFKRWRCQQHWRFLWVLIWSSNQFVSRAVVARVLVWEGFCWVAVVPSCCRSPQRFFCEIAKRASCHFHECQGQIWLKIQSLQCQAKQQWKENLSIYRPDQCCLLLAELSSCDKILIKLHCRAWKNDSLAQGFSKQLQPFTCHFLNCSLLSSFLTTLLPCYIFAGSNQMISQVPLNTPHGIYIIGRSSPAKANLVEIYFAKDPSRGEARLKRRVWHGRCTSSQVQFFISPWRTHIWSPLKPPEMNVMKVQWVKYVGHELGMYQRVEHAVSTRLECNVPRYSTEHGSHKRWIRWINCIGSEGRWRCPKKGCSRRGVIVWPVV